MERDLERGEGEKEREMIGYEVRRGEEMERRAERQDDRSE